MTIETTACDNCGAKKGEGNKWLRGAAAFGGHSEPQAIFIGPEATPPGWVKLDFCSEKCVLQMVSRTLSEIRRLETL